MQKKYAAYSTLPTSQDFWKAWAFKPHLPTAYVKCAELQLTMIHYSKCDEAIYLTCQKPWKGRESDACMPLKRCFQGQRCQKLCIHMLGHPRLSFEMGLTCWIKTMLPQRMEVPLKEKVPLCTCANLPNTLLRQMLTVIRRERGL